MESRKLVLVLAMFMAITAIAIARRKGNVRGRGVGAEDSCEGRCFDSYNASLPCQCDNSCQDRCGIYDGTKACQCDPTCRNYGNCCPDFMTYCSDLLNGTCKDRCGDAYDPHEVCQCSGSCISYDDCCPDYLVVCSISSCAGRCGTPYDQTYPCQCNAECEQFEYCCPDAADECGFAITDSELQSLSQQLWDADVDRLSVTIDLQAQIQDASSVDNAPGPLCLSIPPEINTKPIYTTLQALFDNYIADENVPEEIDVSADAEIDAFLQEVTASSPMKLVWNFLASKQLVPSGNPDASMLKTIWFDLYNRHDVISSSGAEDVLMGETDVLSSSVDGLYNWVRFCTLEQAGQVNYLGYAKTTDYNGAQLVRHPFYWGTNFKAVGELLIGPSPAFDLSIYTLCYYSRPNGLCNLAINSLSLSVQTYVQPFDSKSHLLTAYPAY
ncbi:hypothetical protein CHUAL_009651 [Chamberlinius hualienensis]